MQCAQVGSNIQVSLVLFLKRKATRGGVCETHLHLVSLEQSHQKPMVLPQLCDGLI